MLPCTWTTRPRIWLRKRFLRGAFQKVSVCDGAGGLRRNSSANPPYIWTVLRHHLRYGLPLTVTFALGRVAVHAMESGEKEATGVPLWDNGALIGTVALGSATALAVQCTTGKQLPHFPFGVYGLPVTGIYSNAVIKSFRCAETQKLFETNRSKRFGSIAKAATRKLAQLDAAETLEFLRATPGNRLEELKGDRTGHHSIRINDQWRACFRWTASGPEDVEIIDYHKGE